MVSSTSGRSDVQPAKVSMMGLNAIEIPRMQAS
jgi:hypothetical protein